MRLKVLGQIYCHFRYESTENFESKSRPLVVLICFTLVYYCPGPPATLKTTISKSQTYVNDTVVWQKGVVKV